MIALLLGCRPDVELPAYDGWPLWVDLDLADAADLGHRPTEQPVGPAGDLAFVDVAADVGLGDVAGGGNQHGVGLALVDLDADEDLDLVVANGLSNVTGVQHRSGLYWNQGDGTFADGTDAFGGALDGRDLYSVAAGDVDADGDVDLYFGGQPLDRLLLARGDRTFEDATSRTGAGGPPSDPSLVADGRGKIVSIGDFDGDGWQDLVSATSTRDEGVVLLLNRGDGTFVDRTEASGIAMASDGNPCAVMFTDYDNDGNKDLWIWNDRGGHVLLHHDGQEWQDFGNAADRVSIRNPMGIDGVDLDSDGDLEYYVSNIGDHPLLRNEGDGTFVDVSGAAGTLGVFGWGLAFEDFDLDGHADLFVTQEDALPALVYRNRGDFTFATTELPGPPVIDAAAAHDVPAAFGDIDGDGLVDAVWTRTDGSALVVHRNATDAGGRHFLEVRIPETPGTGERGGIGARVAIEVGGRVQFRDVLGGSSRASQNALSARFGLGGWDGATWVVVLWGDGRQVAYENVPAGVLRVTP